MRYHLLSLVVLAALLPLAACHDDLATPEIALRKGGNGKKDPPPEPEPEPTDPTLPGFYLDGMRSPVRAALTPGGMLLVADAKRQMVLRVNPMTLEPDQGLRVRGKPMAVAHHGQRIYVGNLDRGTVDIYAAQGGGHIQDFGQGAVGYAMDMAVEPALGWVFVIDGLAQQVRVFDLDGQLVRYISGPGGQPQHLVAPTGLALDTVAQQVYVSDYGNGTAAVKIFRYDGTYVGEVSGEGNCGMLGCSGGFSRPQGIALNGNGQLFITDVVLGQVLVFDLVTKKLVTSLGGYPTLHAPGDAVITQAGDLFVVSNLTKSVVLFPGGGAP